MFLWTWKYSYGSVIWCSFNIMLFCPSRIIQTWFSKVSCCSRCNKKSQSNLPKGDASLECCTVTCASATFALTVYMHCLISRKKFTCYSAGSRRPSNTWFIEPTWSTSLNSILIDLAIFSQYTFIANWLTDRQTDWQTQQNDSRTWPVRIGHFRYVCDAV